MRKNYRQPKIVVLLARDSVIYKKSRERGHASAVFVQTQSERANALAAIPYVSNIILIPENFERNYFDLLLKINAKVMAVQEGRDQEIDHCQQHQARFAKDFQKNVLLKIFPRFANLSSSSFFSKYLCPTTKDLKKHLELLGNDLSIRDFAPKISTSKEIKDLVRNQIVKSHPEFSPEELNSFLCKLNADHVGVFCKNRKQKIVEPVKLKPAQILNTQEDFSSYIENKKVIVSGGCFNGIHKGHRAFFRYIKKTYGENAFSIVLLEASQRIKEKQAYEKHAIQNSEQRAEILSKIPGVDLIIKLPHNFKDYLNIIKRLRASALAACEQEQNTLKYYEQHKAQCQSAGLNLEILKVPTIKTNNTKISSRTFFKKTGKSKST